MNAGRHILVIRFSAMGDVAMLVPVLKNLLNQYPDLTVTVVSSAFFAPIFQNIDRCSFHAADLKKIHKGIPGLWKLHREIKKGNRIDAIADLHNVLRSKILRSFFLLKKKGIIDKGRAEKKQLTQKENKQLHQLKTSHQRYADVFSAIGFPIQLNADSSYLSKTSLPEAIAQSIIPGKKLIGIAPFAKHKEKMYPLEEMKKIVELLYKNESLQLFLLGGGKTEKAILQEWEKEYSGTVNVAGKISFTDELRLISNLSLVISMDSANMHLASLYNVPVVSIWGATHPFAGFYGWGQSENNIVQADLYCRPCSVFGNKECYRGDHACMHLISTEMILQKINSNLQANF